MAWVPASNSKKGSLLRANAPNFKDFSGPPDGDYARYVEGLMQWSAQEQERQRLKALGEKGRTQGDNHWGRESAQEAAASALPVVQPGSVDNALNRWKRKVHAQAAKLQQSSLAASRRADTRGQGTATSLNDKVKGWDWVALLVGCVIAGIWVPSLLPVVILGWVAFNVIRSVRAASSSKSS